MLSIPTRGLRFCLDDCRVVALLVVCSLTAALGCHWSRERTSNPNPTGSAAASPHLRIVKKGVDIVGMTMYEDAHGSVSISNQGNQPLQISSIERSRFCSGRAQPERLEPGAQGRIELTCNSDLYGPMREHVFVHTNDPEASRVRLDLEATVTPLLAFDTASVALETPFGQERTAEVRLIGTRANDVKIKLKSEVIPDVAIEALPTLKDQARGFTIRCKGRKPGLNSSSLVITTDLERPREVAIPYACKVIGTLEVNPTNPFFNLKVSGPKSVYVLVRSSQPDFQVHAVYVAGGPFAATFERASEGDYYRVKVTVIEEHIDDETRGVDGRLVIVSNDRSEPRKEIPLFGMGRVNRATPLDP
jgi:hypothetical protein